MVRFSRCLSGAFGQPLRLVSRPGQCTCGQRISEDHSQRGFHATLAGPPTSPEASDRVSPIRSTSKLDRHFRLSTRVVCGRQNNPNGPFSRPRLHAEFQAFCSPLAPSPTARAVFISGIPMHGMLLSFPATRNCLNRSAHEDTLWQMERNVACMTGAEHWDRNLEIAGDAAKHIRFTSRQPKSRLKPVDHRSYSDSCPLGEI